MKRLNTFVSGFFYLIAATGIVISLQNQVSAQSNECPATPQIGYRCYQDRTLRARAGYPGSDTGTLEFIPPQGYRLIDYKESVAYQWGGGGNVNINMIRSGANIQIKQYSEQYDKNLIDRQNQIKGYATVPVEGVPVNVGGELEAIEKSLEENRRVRSLLDNSYSNVDKVTASVTVSGRCTRHVLGACVDNQGGKYEGTIRFMLEYVGTSASISAANEAAIRRADAAILQLAQAPQPTPSPSPSPSACISVDSRRGGWQRFNLNGNFTKIASIGGGWSVDSRNYSPVGAVGHTGRDADLLKPYEQYKFDQRFPFGALLMNSGNGILHIQDSNSLSSAPFGAVDMRINDADNALGDNGGSLNVCFGN